MPPLCPLKDFRPHFWTHIAPNDLQFFQYCRYICFCFKNEPCTICFDAESRLSQNPYTQQRKIVIQVVRYTHFLDNVFWRIFSSYLFKSTPNVDIFLLPMGMEKLSKSKFACKCERLPQHPKILYCVTQTKNVLIKQYLFRSFVGNWNASSQL